MWVVYTLEVIIPTINPRPQLSNDVSLSRHTEYALRLHAPEGKNAIGEERQDDGYFRIRIRPFLHLKNRIKALAKRRGVKRRVARNLNLLRCGWFPPGSLFGDDAQLADAEPGHHVDSTGFLGGPLAHKAAKVDFKVFRGRKGDEENAEELPALEDALTV